MKTGILLASFACASAGNPLEMRLLSARDTFHTRATALASEMTGRILDENSGGFMMDETGASGGSDMDDSMPDSGNMFEEMEDFMAPMGDNNPVEEWTASFEELIQEYADAEENADATICAVGATMEISGSFLDLIEAEASDTGDTDLTDELMEGEQDIVPVFNVPCGSGVDTSRHIMPALFTAYGIKSDEFECRGSACKCAGFNVKMTMLFKLDFEQMLMSGIKDFSKGMLEMDPTTSESNKKKARDQIDQMSFGQIMKSMDPSVDESKDFNDIVKEMIDKSDDSADKKKADKAMLDMMKDGFDMASNIRVNACVDPLQPYGQADLKVQLPDLNAAESDAQQEYAEFKLKADGVVNVYGGSTLSEKKANPPKTGDKVFRYEKNASTGAMEKKECTVVSVDEAAGTVEVDNGSGSTAVVSSLSITTPAEVESADSEQVEAETPQIDGSNNNAVAVTTSATAALILGAFVVLLV